RPSSAPSPTSSPSASPPRTSSAPSSPRRLVSNGPAAPGDPPPSAPRAPSGLLNVRKVRLRRPPVRATTRRTMPHPARDEPFDTSLLGEQPRRRHEPGGQIPICASSYSLRYCSATALTAASYMSSLWVRHAIFTPSLTSQATPGTDVGGRGTRLSARLF